MSVITFKRTLATVALMVTSVASSAAWSDDLQQIRERGVLRHIGVPYANFVSYIEQGEVETLTGLDVEIIKGFAKSLGVQYQYVPAQWSDVVGKLTGQNVQYHNKQAVVVFCPQNRRCLSVPGGCNGSPFSRRNIKQPQTGFIRWLCSSFAP